MALQYWMRLRRDATALVVATVVTGLVACGDSPSSPSSLDAMVISGPETIAPGATANYQAIIFKADNSIIDLTRFTKWTSERPEIVEMRPDGVAIGRSRGEVQITATNRTASHTRRVLVLEDGTFRLTGRATDGDSDVGIGGATVEVLHGIGTGLRATTESSKGTFVLYGVAGAVQLRVSADGYSTSTVDVSVFAPRSQDIPLIPDGHSGVLSGNWTLTVLAPPGCDGLPEAAQTRQFLANITHSGTQRFTALLSSSSVYYADPLRGQIVGDVMTLAIPSYPGDILEDPYYALLDSLQPRGFVGIRGTLRATVAGPSASGVLDGAFDHYQNLPSLGAAAVCEGRGTVSLTREGS